MDNLNTIAAAIKKLNVLEKAACFDPVNSHSRPTPKQSEVLGDIGDVQYRYVVAGNQCLAEGTLVATPEGPVAIEKIKPGDIVYSESGDPIKVKKVFENGEREVTELTNRGQVWAEATQNHTFLTRNSGNRHGRSEEKKVLEFSRDTQIKRVEVDCPLGDVKVPTAYSIGALLGDGCSRQPGTAICLSSANRLIPAKVASQLIGNPVKNQGNNYTWRIKNCFNTPKQYEDWARGRYAHEKIADLEELRTWDRESLVAFIAGLIDTDGSVIVDSWDNLCISLGMQAESVIKAAEYAFMALWQTKPCYTVDSRDKYVNGPVHILRVANNAYSKRILRELDSHLVTPSKKWRDSYSDLVSKRSNPFWIGVKQGETRVAKTYDIHVDSPTNLYLLANGLVTHNSGKSQLGAREVAWVFTETHPSWTRPRRWGDEPLQIIVVGRTSKQVEEVLWRKIKAFLNTSDYKVQKVGGVVQKVEHKETGNTIIFASHHADNEAREKLQAFVAHYVWIDEMPKSMALLEELHRRIQSRGGYFLSTFTPKVRNDEIRKHVDNAKAPHAKKYTFYMFDNPVLTKKDKDAILQSLESQPKQVRDTVLYGAWSVGEEAVYRFNAEEHVGEAEGYSRSWRHVLVVDPALKSKMGYTLWTESPNDGKWYCVRADYISGIYDPNSLVEEAEKRCRGYHIVRRISDPHESWYIGAASSLGYSYMGVYKKSGRKGELIKNLQTALGSKIKISPWCQDLIDEFVSCQWADTDAERIINSSRFHLLDCAQYFVDLIPAAEKSIPQHGFHAQLRIDNKARKAAEYKSQQLKKAKITRKSSWRGRRNWRNRA